MRAAGAALSLLALLAAACVTPPTARASGAAAHPPGQGPKRVFLLIGQSNMAGAPQPAPEDRVVDPRVTVLAYDDCPNLGRIHDQWYPAAPPLHGCHEGVGPGDSFGKAMAEAYPAAAIGLVPLAISGADIDLFLKDVVSSRRREFRIPPDDHWAGAYEWVVGRARLAQKDGAIRGILFHQGESDTGRPEWVAKVKQLVTDLRTDLGIADTPFVAGELLPGGCCGPSHNRLIGRLPDQIPRTRIVSARGLSGLDTAHFDLEGQRELGRRYGTAMLELLAAPASAP
jgi:hypothetical protein